uniref:Uncharacterized protein n=1 Tax=Avena sativa TaxID=4498 RepID=A0ACD5WU15_AVESA
MSFLVTKSSLPVLVGPSEPTPAGILPLTSTDKSRLCRPFTLLHVFDRPIHEPAETVRHALSRALVHYHPIAGRLSVGTGACDADIHIACTGEGVAFVAATANCTLEDARFLHAPLAIPLADLAVRTDTYTLYNSISNTWNHAVADAFGLAQFLQAVGELARGLSPPSVVPVRADGSLPEIPQPLSTALAPRLAGRGHTDFAYTDVTIPWSFINRVKAELFQQGQLPCSTFEVVTAAMWQCRTRATTSGAAANPGSPAPLVFPVNVRSRVGAKDGYYGNCITSQLVTATRGAVADGDIVEVVKLVRRGKERIPDTLEGGPLPVVLDEELVGALCGYGVLVLTSWGGIGLEDMDLGGGRPARVIPYMEMTVLPSSVMCPPCSRKEGNDGSGDGVNVIAFCVREEHADGPIELLRLNAQDHPSYPVHNFHPRPQSPVSPPPFVVSRSSASPYSFNEPSRDARSQANRLHLIHSRPSTSTIVPTTPQRMLWKVGGNRDEMSSAATARPNLRCVTTSWIADNVLEEQGEEESTQGSII